MKKAKSRYARKARINIDGMFSSNGVDQYADAGLQCNVMNACDYDRSFSISWFGQLNRNLHSNDYVIGILSNFSGTTANGLSVGYLESSIDENLYYPRLFISERSSGPTRSIFNAETEQKCLFGVLYYFCITYDHTNQSILVYINSIEQTVNTQITGTVSKSIYDNAEWPMQFHRRINAGNSIGEAITDGYLAHVSIFNKKLNQAEIKSIYLNGGVLPPSTHASCVAHYSMDHIEGGYLHDSVEEYNYAKNTNLVRHHSILVGYTEEQLKGSRQLAWKNFYSKQRPKENYLILSPEGNSNPYIYANAPEITDGGSFTIYLDCILKDDTPVVHYGSVQGNLGVNMIVLEAIANHYRFLAINGVSGVGTNIDARFGIPIKLLLTYDSISQNLNFYQLNEIDGFRSYSFENVTWNKITGYGIDDRIGISRHSSTNQTAVDAVHRWVTFNTSIDVQEAKSLIFEDVYNTSSILDVNFSDALGLDFVDESGNNKTIFPTNWANPLHQNLSDGFIEKKSLKPKIRRGLVLDQSKNQAIKLPSNSIPYSEDFYIHMAFRTLSSEESKTFFSIGFDNTGQGLLTFFCNGTGHLGASKDKLCWAFSSNATIPTNRIISWKARFDGDEIDLNQTIVLTYFMSSNGQGCYINGNKAEIVTRYHSIYPINYNPNIKELVAFNDYDDWSESPNIIIFGDRTNLGSFVERFFSGEMHDFHMGEGVPNEKEILKWHNNGLYSNPEIKPLIHLDFRKLYGSGPYTIKNYGTSQNSADMLGFNSNDLDGQTENKLRMLENIRREKRYPAYYPKYYPKRK